MITDSEGNEYPVAQGLFDALELSKTSLLEELTNKSGKATGQEAAEYLIPLFVRYNTEQTAAIMRAVANLESRLIGLARHLDVGEVEFSEFTTEARFVDPNSQDDENE